MEDCSVQTSNVNHDNGVHHGNGPDSAKVETCSKRHNSRNDYGSMAMTIVMVMAINMTMTAMEVRTVTVTMTMNM